VIDSLLLNIEAKDEVSQSTDARMTPGPNPCRIEGENQAQEWMQALIATIVAIIAAVGFEPTTLGL
jgi:hypothetical protein